jgi:hypothetical protein
MSISLGITVFLLTYTSISPVNSQNVLKEYVIRKDLITGLKATEYTIYDIKEKHVFYRIESKFHLLQSIRLIAYPAKQEVGRLQAKIKPFLYKAEFSIVNPRSNQQVSGLIEQNFKLNGDLFSIQWGENRIALEKDLLSLTNVFRDSTGGEILAQFRIRPASVFWTRKYDMKIFSDKYPEQIYILGLAARDGMISRH